MTEYRETFERREVSVITVTVTEANSEESARAIVDLFYQCDPGRYLYGDDVMVEVEVDDIDGEVEENDDGEWYDDDENDDD